jgi:hypothetical protein
MALPVTIQQFSTDLDQAKILLARASKEADPERQRNLALLASAASQIALAEATWLQFTQMS